MDDCEQSTSFTSDSSLKKKSTDQFSYGENYRNNDEEILEIAEQESEIGALDGDNVDDSKDYDVDDVDEREEDRYIEENEEATEGGARSPANKSQLASDAFDAFEFVRQDTNVTVPDSLIEEEIIPEASDWLDGDKLYTAHVNRVRHFVCIEYPGIIQNQDKALATLGGMEGLSKAVSEDLKIELSFRPNDPFCKPTIGSFTLAKNLLLKIRRRKVPTESNINAGDGYEYQVEVIGIVGKIYIFDKLCDFQYLPVVKEANGKYKDILSSIRPNIKDDRKEYLSRNVPVFLPPYAFSRRDMPVSYNFETETIQPGEENDNVIGMDRKKRFFGTIHISFSCPEVPKEPDPITFKHLEKLPNHDEGLTALKKIFEERPLWSKVGILAHLDKVYHSHLKQLLPVVSYYFINGPWKNLWCKFGYDPRKNPKAKIYQTLDYRVRSMANRYKVEPKRGQEVLRSLQYGLKQDWNAATIYQGDVSGISQGGRIMDLTYIFTSDHIPPYRQMRYQVCDVQLEEVQKMMHENDDQEVTCTERDGWCVPDFTDVCRDHISAAVDKLFAK